MGHCMMAGGGLGVAMRPAEEIQPPFASSSRPIKTKRFRGDMQNIILYVTTKALGQYNIQ
eukprot:scaffold148023_cov36-Cyclotella_meneghiniana.AAC.2